MDIHDEIARQLARAPDMLHMWEAYYKEDVVSLIDALGGDSSLVTGSKESAYHYLMLLVIKRMIGPKVDNDTFNAHIVGVDPDKLFQPGQLAEIIEHMNNLINSNPEGDK